MGSIVLDRNAHLRKWVSEKIDEGMEMEEAIQEYSVAFPDRGEQSAFETALASLGDQNATHFDVVMTQEAALQALETHLTYKRDRAVVIVKNSQNYVQEVAVARARLKATKQALADCMDNPAVARALNIISKDVSDASYAARKHIEEVSAKRRKIEQMENDIEAIRAQRLALK